jgi:hypothetical protein
MVSVPSGAPKAIIALWCVRSGGGIPVAASTPELLIAREGKGKKGVGPHDQTGCQSREGGGSGQTHHGHAGPTK